MQHKNRLTDLNQEEGKQTKHATVNKTESFTSSLLAPPPISPETHTIQVLVSL